jgi:hypothetical protein
VSAKGSLTSVQVSQVHRDAIGSGRILWVVWELEFESRGPSADLSFFDVWAEGFKTARGRDSDLEGGARRLEPALAVPIVSIIWISSSESRVKSMALLSTLSFAAFSTSLWASAPEAQAVLSRLLNSAA